MQVQTSRTSSLALIVTLVIAPLLLASCAGGGSGGGYRPYGHYPPGFSSYHHRPWWGYRPIIIDGRDRQIDPDWSVPPPRGGVTPPDHNIDPDWGVEPPLPSIEPMPDLGMPDVGGMDADFGVVE